MAPKKKKAKPPKAQDANSSSAPQGSHPKSRKAQASRSQAQQLKPKPKLKPKPADTRASTKNPEASHQTKASTPAIPAPRVSISAPKTTVTVSKADNTNGQAQSSNKKRKHQPAMARGNRNNNANPGHDPRTAGLELPEGYIHPRDQPRRNNRRNRGRRANGTPSPPSPPAPGPDLFPTPVLALTPAPAPAPVLPPAPVFPPGKVFPWVLNPKYPKPLGGFCVFDYGRDEWRSLAGMDVASEMEKQFTRSRIMGLRRPSSQMNEEQLKKLHQKYWQEREPELYKTRLAIMSKLASPKLFIATSGAYNKGFDPVNAEDSPLIRFMRIPELGKMVLDLLNPSIGDLTALATTCKIAAACVRQSLESWDFTSGYFPTDNFCKKRDRKNGRLLQAKGVRANTLVVSPASNESKVQDLYTADLERVWRLCGSMLEIPFSFRTIILDQVPLLNVDMFEVIVNSMPNLDSVTITRCVMLDVTKLKPLLEVIRRHPRKLKPKDTMPHNPQGESSADDADDAAEPRQAGATASGNTEYEQAQAAKGKQRPKEYIKLDFFPYFFHGPDTATRLGSYGVTWNEPTFDTPKAVFSQILQCWSLAKEVGMDLVSESSSFWSFVRRLPGPDVLWAMKAREALVTREYEYRRGVKSRDAIDDKFAADLTAALMGDNQQHPTAPLGMRIRAADDQMMEGAYWEKMFMCKMCHFRYPRSLFPLRIDTCWGCKMALYVHHMEDSHLRLWQDSTVEKLLSGLNPRTANLGNLLSKSRVPHLKNAIKEINCADWTRAYFLSYYDINEKVSKSSLLRGNPTTTQLVAFGYGPPPPKSLDHGRASMARWRWYYSPVTAAFDYRQGGPQRKHPCKDGPTDLANTELGPESKESFQVRWEGTDSRAMENERRDQNRRDRTTFMWHQPRVEDCLYSMSTPGRMAYNLDQPIPDPGVNPAEYNKVLMDFQWTSSNYCYQRRGGGW